MFAIDSLGLDEAWWLVSPGNPLKPETGMAPLNARVASARAQARRAPILVTAIERQLGSPFTIDTIRTLVGRYPKRRFVWLMGSDNLAQFHRWRNWRAIARSIPIAVIARPGYESAALTSPAMAWLRRHRISPAELCQSNRETLPAMVYLRFDPDTRSATAIRNSNTHWDRQFAASSPRDALTFDRITGAPE